MSRVLVIQSFWGRPSNQFLVRHLEMLAAHDALAAIAVLFPTRQRRWRGVPVVSLSDPPAVAGLARWALRGTLRRLGLRPAVLARRPAAGLTRLLASTTVDAILCQYATTASALWEVLAATPCRLFIHLHGADTHEAMCPAGHRDRVVAMSRRAVLICNSAATRARMLAWGVAPERLVVKHPGVEVPARPPQRAPCDEVVVLQLGRLVAVKGPTSTVRAFELASEQGLRGRLILAGDGPLAAECRRQVARSPWRDRIELPGAVAWEHGRQLRRRAHIYTQHNLQDPVTGQVEAFGVAVVEAMADALPVVASRSGGIPEIVVDGVTGVLVEPGDEAAQAAALLALARSPTTRATMGEAGWARARDRFSVEHEARSLVRILELT